MCEDEEVTTIFWNAKFRIQQQRVYRLKQQPPFPLQRILECPRS